MVGPLLAFLKKFDWKQFVLIVASNETNLRIKNELLKQAAKHNLTISRTYSIDSFYSCITDQLKRIVEESCDRTRIYVLLANSLVSIDLIKYLHRIRPKVFRQYAVVLLDYDIVYSSVDEQNYFNSLIDRGGGGNGFSIYNALFVITPSPATSADFDSFCERVANRTRSLEATRSPRHNMLAALAFDSVMIYANALARALASKANSTEGQQLVAQIRNRTYRSALGFDVRLDSNGDAEGRYVVLTLSGNDSLLNKSRWRNQPFFANFEQVAIFLKAENSSLPTVHFLKPSWLINKRQLRDEPECGFGNEKCRKKILLLITAFIILFVLLMIGLCGLLKYLIHAELDIKHWKIDFNDVSVLAIDKNQDCHDVVKTIKVGLLGWRSLNTALKAFD